MNSSMQSQGIALALLGFFIGGISGGFYMVRVQVPASETLMGSASSSSTVILTLVADYVPSYERAMAAKKGETVSVLRDDDGEWLKVKNSRGDQGWVPRSFVTP